MWKDCAKASEGSRNLHLAPLLYRSLVVLLNVLQGQETHQHGNHLVIGTRSAAFVYNFVYNLLFPLLRKQGWLARFQARSSPLMICLIIYLLILVLSWSTKRTAAFVFLWSFERNAVV